MLFSGAFKSVFRAPLPAPSIQHGSRVRFLQSSFDFILNENISYVNQK
jgi:hypothetical protein